MFILPPTVGADQSVIDAKPLLPEIERDVAVLNKYSAISGRVAQNLAVNAAEQWSGMTFWAGVALGVGGVLLVQWLGTSLIGIVKDATTDPGAIAEKVVKKLQGSSKK